MDFLLKDDEDAAFKNKDDDFKTKKGKPGKPIIIRGTMTKIGVKIKSISL